MIEGQKALLWAMEPTPNLLVRLHQGNCRRAAFPYWLLCASFLLGVLHAIPLSA